MLGVVLGVNTDRGHDMPALYCLVIPYIPVATGVTTHVVIRP